MKQSSYFRLRLFISTLFLACAIIIPIMIIKIYSEDYSLDILERFQIWLVVDGALLVLETLVARFISSFPIIPDFMIEEKDNGKVN